VLDPEAARVALVALAAAARQTPPAA